MKKTLALLLALALALPLFSCGGSRLAEPESEETAVTAAVTAAAETETAPAGIPDGFAVGYAREDITPTDSVPLAGHGNTTKRMSTKVLDKLYITCVAFSDGENVALMFTVDLVNISDTIDRLMRHTVAKATGVPEDMISFTATHTHSGPDMSQTESLGPYYTTTIQAAGAAAKAAIRDLAPAEMAYGTARTKGMNFVRRYLLADGSYSQNNSGNYPAPIVAHETEADPEMRFLKISREGKKDVVLVNWQAHATMTGGSFSTTDISADYIGSFRKEAEKELDCLFGYFQGAAGNLNPKSLISGETEYADYRERGKAMTQVLKEGLAGSLTPVAAGAVRSVHRVFTGKVNHMEETPERIAQAREVSAALKRSNEEAAALAAKYNFANYFSATSLLSRLELGETLDMDLYAFAFGDFAFTTNPFEMFDTNGMEIRAGSPFAAVMNFSYSNGSRGYIPSAFAYPHRGYEGTTTRYVAGTGEEVVAELVSMLNELHGN